MSAEREEALEVLREVWRGNGQAATDLDKGDVNACRRMTEAGVGFGEFAAEDAAGTDVSSGWQERLKREGKYHPQGGTIRDLIMGPDSLG
ncbi:MAG TPA: hypothetical protein VH478_19895 [Trebonia sp.]|jgi:predicted secreted protein|nr:hypothetical protein [Trebonia sp.]